MVGLTLKTWAVLLVALTAVLALAGCPDPDRPDHYSPRPPTTPATGAVRPGATCEPRGTATAVATDGRELACSINGRWYVR